jgi:hypothetical protein
VSLNDTVGVDEADSLDSNDDSDMELDLFKIIGSAFIGVKVLNVWASSYTNGLFESDDFDEELAKDLADIDP